MTPAPGEYFVCFWKQTCKDESWEDWRRKMVEGAPKSTIKEGETTRITLELPKK